MNYLCPICKNLLHSESSLYRCERGHCFDVAKEGYVNLLPVQKKKKKDPGDNAEMVLSREQFLSKGYFDPLIEKICETLSEGENLLDIGCGTGYYDRRIKEKKAVSVCGIDISRHAVRLAAKRDRAGQYAVASAFDLPFADESFDVLLNVFAPKAEEEYLRVLKRGGKLVEVVPGKEHLLEIKQKLYESVRLNDERSAFSRFSSAESVRVKFFKEIASGEHLTELLTMTPYRYKTPQDALKSISSAVPFFVTFDFILRIHTK